MSVLRIKWAGYCPACDSDELDVHTDKGTPEYLYAGDGVVCSECGEKGEIDVDDNCAFAVWEWKKKS